MPNPAFERTCAKSRTGRSIQTLDLGRAHASIRRASSFTDQDWRRNQIRAGRIEVATVFELGKAYKRRDEIHGVYGGQAQGGISTPTIIPYIFLFISNAGKTYGYNDSFRPDGSLRPSAAG